MKKTDNRSLYEIAVQDRSKLHYIIGLLVRWKNNLQYAKARRIARKRGAKIGENVIMSVSLAKRMNENVRIGDSTSIQTDAIDFRSPVTIGSHVIIGYGTEIITTSHQIDSPDWEHKYYGITIDDYAWIPTKVLVLPSCRHIGYGAVIGSGSVVVKDVEDMSVVSGNPAKEFKKRKCVHSKLVVESLLGGGFSNVQENQETKKQKCEVTNYNIIFATNDDFCSHAAEAIISLLETNPNAQITIHLFTIDCKESNINRIVKIVKDYHQETKTYKIAKSLFTDFPETGAYSLACYLRLLTPALLPDIDKALYLDCDLIVNGDIQELYDINLEGYAVAAVHDATLSYGIVKDYLGYDYWRDGYFNSGVLLMNLKFWREKGLQSKLVSYLNSHHVALPDQDALNIVLHGSVKWLHPKWNCHVGYFAFPPLVIDSQKEYIKELWTKAKIIHFTGPVKPWYKECVNPYKKKYLKYRKIANWYSKEKLDRKEHNLYKSIQVVFLRYCKNIVARIISYTY